MVWNHPPDGQNDFIAKIERGDRKFLLRRIIIAYVSGAKLTAE